MSFGTNTTSKQLIIFLSAPSRSFTAMKYRNTFKLFLLLRLLSLVAYFQFNTREKKFQSKTQETPLFPGLNTDQTVRVEIITPTKRTVLVRRGKKWLVATSGNYPADVRIVNIFFRRLKSLSVGEVVTDKPQKHSTFKVDGTGIKVKLFGDGENLQAAFYVGKTDDDYVDTYLRKEGEDKVLVIHDNIQQIFVPYEWRSHYLFHFQPGDIREVVITYPEKVIRIKQREDGTWEEISPRKFSLNGLRIKKFLKMLCSVRSLDFAKQEMNTKIPDNPEFKIQIQLKDESVWTLVVGEAANPVSLYVWVLEKTPVFLVSTRWLDRLQQVVRRIF